MNFTHSPDSVDEPDETANIIIFEVHTSGYEKEGSADVTIENIPRLIPDSIDIRTDSDNNGYINTREANSELEESLEDVFGKPIIHYGGTLPHDDFVWQEFIVRTKVNHNPVSGRTVKLEFDDSALYVKDSGGTLTL